MRIHKGLLAGTAATLLMGLSGTAQAQNIQGSAHDFSLTTGNNNAAWSNGEICLPCHTTHNVDKVNQAPLWNHALTTASTYQTYQYGSSLYKNLTAQDADVALDPVSVLCMSCHDGTVNLDAFGGAAGGTKMGDLTDPYALVSTDLSDDHPVGATGDYPPVGGDFNTKAAVETAGLFFVTFDPDGAGANPAIDAVSCATCHDPHNGADATHLLRIDNAASGLCLTCHAK